MEDTIKGNPNCQLCPLHETAQYVCLMGRGRIPTKVMIVGEAPGAREDDVGKPFQGPAGKLLDSLLAEVGINREHTYISNAVKCRPPENRTPRPKELKACKPYLEDELKQVRPKYVLLLGATALKQLFGKSKITEIHGEPISRDGVTYFPTFHPAAALRDPKRLPILKYDMKRFGDLVAGKQIQSAESIKYTLVDTEEGLERMLINIESPFRTSFDLETTCLNPRDGEAHINLLGIGTPEENFVIPLALPYDDVAPWTGRTRSRKEMQRDIVKEICERLMWGRPKRKRTNVAQNGKFDNLWLHIHYGVFFPLDFDTMLSSSLANENDSSSLKHQVKVKLNGPSYDVDNKLKRGMIPREDLPKLYEYNAKDVHYTLQLYDYNRKQLAEQDGLLTLMYKMMMPVARAYEKIELAGTYVDEDQLQKTGDELRVSLKAATSKLDSMSGTRRKVNWNSPKQVGEILFNRLGIQPQLYTGGGDPSTSEPALLGIEHPIVKALLEQRGAQKLLSGFVDSWLGHMDENGFMYPSFKLNGANTGRPSCEDPNIQQTPRDVRIRRCVTAPKGWTLWEIDYSQIELRIAAQLSQCPGLLRAFQTGVDVHALTASNASGIRIDKVTKEQRKSAKAINFGFLFGMGWFKFISYALEKYGVTVSAKQSKNFRHRFFESYPGLLPWHERQRRVAHTCKQVRTLTGRIRHLPDIDSPDKGVVAQAERNAINSPVQGFAAELTLMAIEHMMDELYDPDKFVIFGTVHDATLGRVRDRLAREYLERAREIMIHPRLMDVLGIELNVPIEVEVKTGNWGEGKEMVFHVSK